MRPNNRFKRVCVVYWYVTWYSILDLAIACCTVEGGILTRPTSTRKPWIQAVLSACNCTNPKAEEIESLTARYRASISEFGLQLSSGFLQHIFLCFATAEVGRFVGTLSDHTQHRFTENVSGQLLKVYVCSTAGQQTMMDALRVLDVITNEDDALVLLLGKAFLQQFIFDQSGVDNLGCGLRHFPHPE